MKFWGVYQSWHFRCLQTRGFPSRPPVLLLENDWSSCTVPCHLVTLLVQGLSCFSNPHYQISYLHCHRRNWFFLPATRVIWADGILPAMYSLFANVCQDVSGWETLFGQFPAEAWNLYLQANLGGKQPPFSFEGWDLGVCPQGSLFLEKVKYFRISFALNFSKSNRASLMKPLFAWRISTIILGPCFFLLLIGSAYVGPLQEISNDWPPNSLVGCNSLLNLGQI